LHIGLSLIFTANFHAVRFLGLLTAFLGFHYCLVAQVTVQPVSARYLPLGTYSGKFNDVFGAKANAASLSTLKRGGIGVYGEKRFGVENLNIYALSAALPTTSGTFGISGNYSGFSQSNQSQLTLSYGRKITQGVDVGASFHYHNISQAGIYGSNSAITGSLSMLLHLSEKITAGFNIYNPFRASWSKVTEDERLPARYTFGIGYDASDKFYLTTELEKEESQPLNVNFAMHYQFIQQLFVRGGVATQTSSYFAGLGIQFSDFRFDITSSFHPQLGISPGAVLIYNFGKIKEDSKAAPEQ